MGTIGYNSTVNVAEEGRQTTSPHFILSSHGTYTPSVNQTLTKAGVWVSNVPSYASGQIEVGVYRVSNKALVASTTVTTGTPGSVQAYEANFSSGTLLAGVEYCYAFRIVANASVMRYDTGSTTGDRNSGLTGANALANPFTTTGEGLTSIWGIYALTADSATAATISGAIPTGTLATQTTATIGCTTDQASGTLYYIASINQSKITGVTAAQIKAGKGADGVTLGRNGSAAISTTSPSISGTGFTTGALYYAALVQENTNGFSNVITWSFTMAAAGPTITGLSVSPNYQGGLTITGTGFPTAQTGSAAVTIGGVAQTVTWNTTTSCSISSVARGALKYGVSVNVVVTDAAGNSSSGYATTLSPQAGWAYTDTSGTLATTGDRITASPDLASGDQIVYGNVQGGTIADVTVYADGSFSYSPGVTAFDVSINDGTGFSAAVTQTIAAATTSVGGIARALSTSPTRAITSAPT